MSSAIEEAIRNVQPSKQADVRAILERVVQAVQDAYAKGESQRTRRDRRLIEYWEQYNRTGTAPPKFVSWIQQTVERYKNSQAAASSSSAMVPYREPRQETGRYNSCAPYRPEARWVTTPSQVPVLAGPGVQGCDGTGYHTRNAYRVGRDAQNDETDALFRDRNDSQTVRELLRNLALSRQRNARR